MYVYTYIYMYMLIYMYIYIHISVVTRVFLDIPVHISNVYFSKTKGPKGSHHSWKLFQKEPFTILSIYIRLTCTSQPGLTSFY